MLLGRRGCEMLARVLDQPFIAVAGGHVENVERDHGDDRPIWTVDIAYGKDRVGDREVGFDETDPIVRECRLRGCGDRLLRLTEFLHHGGVPLQRDHRRHERSVFGE